MQSWLILHVNWQLVIALVHPHVLLCFFSVGITTEFHHLLHILVILYRSWRILIDHFFAAIIWAFFSSWFISLFHQPKWINSTAKLCLSYLSRLFCKSTRSCWLRKSFAIANFRSGSFLCPKWEIVRSSIHDIIYISLDDIRLTLIVVPSFAVFPV